MAHFIKEELFVDSGNRLDNMVSFGLETPTSFYISNNRDDSDSIHLSFTKEDWDAIKNFIDEQFKKGI